MRLVRDIGSPQNWKLNLNENELMCGGDNVNLVQSLRQKQRLF